MSVYAMSASVPIIADATLPSCDSASGLTAILCGLKLSYEPSYWIIQAVALTITAFLLPGLRITSILGPIMLVAGLAIVNAFLWDASLFFHIPKDISTHAILIVLWNALIFWFLVKLIPGVEIRGFVAPVLAPILITVTTLFAGQYATKIDWEKLATGVAGEVQVQRDLLRRTEERKKHPEGRPGASRPAEPTPAAPAPTEKNKTFEKF